MKIKNVSINLLVYFLYMLGSCILAMLAESMLVFFAEKFVAIPYPVLTVIRIVIYSAAVPALMAVLGYFEGYREGEFSAWEVLISGGLACVLHLIFAMLFKFQGFVSGAVRFTAGLIHNGWDITYDSLIISTPYSLFLLVFVAYGAVYVAALCIAKFFGAQKRIMDRADLRRDEVSDEVAE